VASVELTDGERALVRDALHYYADNRRKVARRRDNKENHGRPVIERALADFFDMANDLEGRLGRRG
jgi:hypothetical protein